MSGLSSDTIDAQQGNTALIAAAFSGKAVFLRMLLDAGANKEAKNQVCRCDLSVAAVVDSELMSEKLLP